MTARYQIRRAMLNQNPRKGEVASQVRPVIFPNTTVNEVANSQPTWAPTPIEHIDSIARPPLVKRPRNEIVVLNKTK